MNPIDVTELKARFVTEIQRATYTAGPGHLYLNRTPSDLAEALVAAAQVPPLRPYPDVIQAASVETAILEAKTRAAEEAAFRQLDAEDRVQLADPIRKGVRGGAR